MTHDLNTQAPSRQPFGLAQLEFQIMWNRLLAVVEEQAQALMQTAFCPLVRECGDTSVGVFDLQGRMLAQAVTGTPGHVNSMAESVAHFIERFPVATMQAGDAYITNDPWMGTGHLNDFVVVTPSFHRGRVVALFACTAHIMDIGGIGFSPDATDLYMEGLSIPLMKLFDAGEPNQTLLQMIRANSRLPIDSEGDTYALAACNDVGARRLAAMLAEFDLDDIVELGAYILARSREAVLTEIQKLPQGQWHYSLTFDGYEAPITLALQLTITAQAVHLDFSGSSQASRYGINSPYSYAKAYAVYALSCAIAPGIPNNAGSLEAYTMSAPAGSILNATRPAPVACRHLPGHLLPDLVFGCLAQIVPERVPAEGTSCLWMLNLQGRDERGQPFSLSASCSGGTGAMDDRDGMSTTAFPSGVRGTPVELAERLAPVVFWRKELRDGSGGSGRHPGGLGQVIELGSRIGRDVELLASFNRVDYPARGRDGGGPGATGYVGLVSGEKLRAVGRQSIPAGQRLLVMTPGGGGQGTPEPPSSDAVQQAELAATH